MTQLFTKYYQKSRAERLQLLVTGGYLSQQDADRLLKNETLSEDVANHLIENQIGQFPLPLGIAPNFMIDDVSHVIPMVVEEPSVIAACSNGGKVIAQNGGFTTSVTERGLIGQIIIQDLDDIFAAANIINTRTAELIEHTKTVHPSIVARGGGVKKVETRVIDNENNEAEFLTIHLIVDVKDAMGANIVNTILEGTKPLIESWLGGTILMAILSNYNDHALATATCKIKPADLTTNNLTGTEIIDKIVAATRYANLDPYRAATHNKGIMNGIDSVLIATGNDPRALAAGAHAYASRSGHYRSLTSWKKDQEGNLCGELTMPVPVGTVGGAIGVLPLAQTNLAILNCENASDLARVIVTVGLAQNFSALRALVSVGIQKGHMGLHANSLAITAGASGAEIEQVANKLKENSVMNSQLAQHYLAEIRNN